MGLPIDKLIFVVIFSTCKKTKHFITNAIYKLIFWILYIFLIRKYGKENITKKIMFYFYFEPIVGSEVKSGSVRWTGECSPKLAILTAQTTLSFGLSICNCSLEWFLFFSGNSFLHCSSFLDVISSKLKALSSSS